MGKAPGVRARATAALRMAAGAGLIGASLGGAAYAGEPAPGGAEAPVATASEPQEVAPVTVEAARSIVSRNEKLTGALLDTPKTVSVVTSDVIRRTGSLTLQDALRTVPGITFTSGEGGTPSGDRPTIRGFEASSDIFVDGLRDAGAQSREVFAVDQVEVVKGPSSAISGRGSTGGAINIITKQAQPTTFVAGGVTLGTDETRRVTGDVNYVLTDGIALRVNALYHENNVAGRDAVNGDRWGVAPSLGIGLGGRSRAYVDYYHLETDELPDFGIPYARTTVNGVVFGRPIKGYNDDFYGLKNRDFRKTQADIGTLRLEHDFGSNVHLSNSTRYGETSNKYVWTNPDDSRGNVANGYVFRSSKNRNTETKTLYNLTNLTAEFATGAIRHSVAVGFEIGEEKTHSQGYIVSSPGLGQAIGFPPVTAASRVDQAPTPANPGCSGPARLGAAFGYNCTTLQEPNPDDPWIGTVTRSPAFTDTKVETRALYLFDTIELSPQWLLNLGVRWDDYENRLTGVNAAVAATAPFVTLTPVVPLQNEDSFVNVLAGVTWKPTAATSVYVSYATSSNPSGEGAGDTSVVAANTVNLDAEENETFEAGAKHQLFGGDLLLAAAVFRTDKTNARVTDASGVLSTVGDSRVDGLELSVTGQITERWSAFGGYTYLDSEIRDGGFQNNGTTAAPIYVPSTTNGNRFLNTPKHAFALTTSYRLTDQFAIGGSAQYQAKRFVNAANTFSVPSYWAFDANAQYDVTETVTVQLNLQNLTNERYALRPFTTHATQIAPGRTGLLSVFFRY